jgi:hypothetical protein
MFFVNSPHSWATGHLFDEFDVHQHFEWLRIQRSVFGFFFSLTTISTILLIASARDGMST